MDIARESVAKRRAIKRAVWSFVVVAGLITLTVGLSRLEPALPSVPRASVQIGTVERGSMLRDIRGTGTLVPEIVWWIPAMTAGRVERILGLPGTIVESDTILLELSDPQLELDTVDAEWQMKSTEADLASLKVRLRNDLLERRASVARADADLLEARLRHEVNRELFEDGLISQNNLKLSGVRVEELIKLNGIEQQRLAMNPELKDAQLSAQIAKVEQARALHALKRTQSDALRVRAGAAGVLEQMHAQVGERVIAGATLAKVTDPDQLKAVIKIPETQAREVQIGQIASIDTRNGIVAGKVVRIDPAAQQGSVAVDVAFLNGKPTGARPDQNVLGTIEIERLDEILYVGRPVIGQAFTRVEIFKLDAAEKTATRVQMEFGKTSVRTVEVTSGLKEGDKIVLTDMSRWDAVDRIALE